MRFKRIKLNSKRSFLKSYFIAPGHLICLASKKAINLWTKWNSRTRRLCHLVLRLPMVTWMCWYTKTTPFPSRGNVLLPMVKQFKHTVFQREELPKTWENFFLGQLELSNIGCPMNIEVPFRLNTDDTILNVRVRVLSSKTNETGWKVISNMKIDWVSTTKSSTISMQTQRAWTSIRTERAFTFAPIWKCANMTWSKAHLREFWPRQWLNRKAKQARKRYFMSIVKVKVKLKALKCFMSKRIAYRKILAKVHSSFLKDDSPYSPFFNGESPFLKREWVSGKKIHPFKKSGRRMENHPNTKVEPPF